MIWTGTDSVRSSMDYGPKSEHYLRKMGDMIYTKDPVFCCFYSLLLFACHFIWISAQEPCPSSYPSSCKCYPSSNGVNCDNLGDVAAFPRVFSNDTKWLILQKSQIRNITKDDLKDLPELVELTVTNGWLSYIEEGCFQQLPNISKIYLSTNRLDTKNLQNGIFANLTNLRTVRLDGNPITELPNDIFKNSPVQFLNLANTQLNLQGLQSIGNGSVAKFLKALSLEGNSHYRLTQNVFSGLRDLRAVNIINCNIQYIHRDFLKGTKVTRVNLYKNPIVKIASDAMQGDQILDFSCRSCGLTSEKVFGEESFFLRMTSLNRLDLGHNNIRHVPKDAFEGMTKLETLLLFNNNISTIEENPFLSLPSPSAMGIQNNPFKCDCKLAWFHKYAVENLDKDVVKDMKCASPTNLSGKAFNELSASQFCCKATANKTAVCGVTCKINCNGSNTNAWSTLYLPSLFQYSCTIGLCLFTNLVSI